MNKSKLLLKILESDTLFDTSKYNKDSLDIAKYLGSNEPIDFKKFKDMLVNSNITDESKFNELTDNNFEKNFDRYSREDLLYVAMNFMNVEDVIKIINTDSIKILKKTVPEDHLYNGLVIVLYSLRKKPENEVKDLKSKIQALLKLDDSEMDMLMKTYEDAISPKLKLKSFEKISGFMKKSMSKIIKNISYASSIGITKLVELD